MKKQAGITLVALVITIIILLILAGVAISMITGGEGLFAKANDAATKYNEAAKNEADLINQLLNGNYLNNGGNGQGEEEEKTEGASINNDSHVGYYADMNADGKIDGIIFADLAVGGPGEWKCEYQTESYTVPTVENTKEYYISQTDYSGAFGVKDVLSPKAGSIGEDRFYIMTLENFGGDTYYKWYNAATNMSDYATVTSVEFGKGRTNTAKMIEYWENKTYGEQNTNETWKDIWGEIQSKVDEGWFVPSRDEWRAFAGNFEIKAENCKEYGLDNRYWSSSQKDGSNVIPIYFRNYGGLGIGQDTGTPPTQSEVSTKPDSIHCVRLCTTF